MSALDRTEKVLSTIRKLLANGVMYDEEQNLVVVSKTEMLEQLNELNECMDQVMEEYEQTRQSRNKAERDARKKQEESAKDAGRMAQDVYAASILYTDEAIQRLLMVMQDSMDSVENILKKTQESLSDETKRVKENQAELNSCLLNMRDSKKYQHLIEEQNRLILKEKEEREREERELDEMTSRKALKPEVKINEAYFIEHGIPLSDGAAGADDAKEPVKAEVNVNLDSEYFRRKGQADFDEVVIPDDNKKEGRTFPFGRKKKSE